MKDDYIKGDKVKDIDGELVSGYILNAQTVFEQLNEVSPSFCLAKWFNVSIHIPTGQTHSCYHPRSHKIPLEEVVIDVSALHNTKYKKEQRKKMLEGERPSECNFCWETEDSGNSLSDRAYRSKDIYEDNIIDEAKQLGFEGNARPRYVEVNFNQACNFRCTYCSPHLSTAWMDDIKRHGPYLLQNRIHNDITWIENEVPIDNSPQNPYLKAFWEWLPDIYPTLQTFRMTGGEPLMDKNTFKMFEYIKSHPKQDLNLAITSNCCPPGNQWTKFMEALKSVTDENSIDHFMLFCSLDSWGKQAEYIRDGLNFDQMLKNVKDFLLHSHRHSLTFIITFNVLSYPRILEYIQNILKLRRAYSRSRQLIWFDIPQLHSPDFLNPKVYPEMVIELEKCIKFMKEHKEGRGNQFMGFKDFEISKIQRLIDWIKSDTGFDVQTARKNFYLFFDQYDERRGTNFLKVFPELKDFWEQCKNG